ncbi:MAG TPA: alpha/beta fold hydrolase [Nocardioidaceae bacterium]|nr:alpha/beta fold hydrolase [Nocardioidaceae bacterium]
MVSLAAHADPFFAAPEARLEGGSPVGVLLCHGFTGSPASVVPWGRYLAEQGYAVSVPRLPGHGTTWQEMNRTGWEDWHGEVQDAFAKLTAICDQVVVGGLSMGGALALALAGEHGRQVAGVMVVNPAVNSSRKDAKLLPLLKHVLPSMPGITNDIKKPGGEEYGYDRMPLRATHSMMTAWKQLRTDLPRVTAPLLLFRSSQDHVVDPSSARIILGTVSSRDVTERIVENSYHVATLDNDAPAIFEESAAFVRRVTAGG